MAKGVRIIDHSLDFLDAENLAIERGLTKIGDKCATYASMIAPHKTGTLRRSIEKKVVMSEKVVYVGSNLEYAVYQEVGTSKMLAANDGRGYLKPAVQEHMSEYKDILNQEVNGL